MKLTRGASYLRIAIYIVLFMFGLFLYIVAERIGFDNSIVDLLKRVAPVLMVSAALIPAINLLVDNILRVHLEETQSNEKRNDQLKKLGVVQISARWRDLVVRTDEGFDLNAMLSDYMQDSRWYVVTINPRGLVGDFFRRTIADALRGGSSIKWSYLKMPRNARSQGDQNLINWWLSRYELTRTQFDREESFARLRDNLGSNIQTLKNEIDFLAKQGQARRENFELYENSIPTMFLGLLAIKDFSDNEELEAADGKLSQNKSGLVLTHPYQMYQVDDDRSWGMVLRNGGELYYQYAISILRFFRMGVERGHMIKKWP